jgi:amino acid adenylation domain-containing protein
MQPQKAVEEVPTTQPMLADAEAHKILVEFNQTAAPYRRDVCVHQLFEEQVERTPDAIAVVCEERCLTYRELNIGANRLAHYLRKRGAGPEGLVGIYVKRSPEMMIGVLGILKSGAAYVPLDPVYPQERLAMIMEDAKASLIVTQSPLLTSLPQNAARTLCLDADWPEIATESHENPTCEAGPQNLSYVLFTSGSTGRPKGVQVEHRNLVNLLSAMQRGPGISGDGVLLAVATLCFDMSVVDLYLPLTSGATLVLATPEQAADGRQLLSLMKRSGATMMQATPSTWRMLLLAGWRGEPKVKVLCGGEAWPHGLATELFPHCTELWNMYGPTETTVWSSSFRVESGQPEPVPIGSPIANTSMYILDDQRSPVGLGVLGELYIGGDGVARGYLHRPELTAERFLDDPFSSIPAARMYRTGDLARFLPDGAIQYVGRADSQVKVRGFRIELGEIELRLAQHHSVQSAVVVAREDSYGDKRLAAYVVPAAGEQVRPAALIAFLRATLPEYMVPSAFVSMHALPLSLNGKIDRLAFPAPEARGSGGAGDGPARDELEALLLDRWQDALGARDIGVTDNFFDLGGNSLTAARLLFEIENIAGREIPLNVFLRGATVEKLARLIRDGSESAPDPVLMTIQAGSGVPFFAVVPPGEDSLGFALLARHMGRDQPLHKLQGREPVITGRRPCFTQDELTALSREYISAMRSVQPEGPYCLGAVCDGVQIAERIVLDLEAQGDEVGFFAIFDTWVLQNVQRPWLWRLAYYGERFDELRKASPRDRWGACVQAVRNNLSRVATTGQLGIKKTVSQAHWPADFVAARFRAPVTLFKKPKQPYFYVNDPLMGWGTRCESRVEVHEVDFDHDQIFREPHVREVGAVLSADLKRVGRRREGMRPHASFPFVHELAEEA